MSNNGSIAKKLYCSQRLAAAATSIAILNVPVNQVLSNMFGGLYGTILFPLDNIKVLRFYDFALILPMVSSCYQQYSVSPSEGKLIPNSALFIYHFVSFTPGF